MESRALSPSSSWYQSKLSTLFHLSRSASTPSSLLQRRSRALVLPLQRRWRSVDVVTPTACLKLEEERVSETGRKWGKVSAVLFDMDGVLRNSEEPSRRAAVDVFAEMGAKVTVDDFVRFMGTGEANFLGGVASVKGVEGFNTKAAKKRSFEIYLDKYAKPNSGIGFPGALELITQCKRKGLKVAVASSADRIKVDANLAAAGLPFSLFDAIVSADAFENLKPAPDIFLAASKILNVPISECIVIEDALAGVQAAKAAQMRCTAVTTTLAEETLKTAGPALIRQEIGTMNTTTTTTTTTPELPYPHFEPKYHTPETPPTFKLSYKAILNLLNTKCTTSLQHLKQTHALILKIGHFQDHYISGSFLKSYANPHFGTLDFAIQVFKQVRSPNVFVWNFLFKGFLDNNQPFNAITFYSKMVASDSKPNKHTYLPLLKACTLLGAVEEGVQVHAHMVKFRLSGDKYIKSAGIRMYASFGRVLDARNMFEESTESDVVCGNAMIDGYMKCGYVEEARKVFEDMIEKNIGTWTVMISGFARCGMIEEAREMFNGMPERDYVSWSAIIDGYNKRGYYKEALEIFQEMQREKIKPKKFVLSSVLASCANVGALNQGRWIHTYIQSNSIPLNEVLGTSLVDMYAQCGCIDLAWEVFGKMKHKEVFSWNAMIGGLAVNGHAKDAIELFCKMQREKVKPNAITFVGILNACAHEGLVDEGLDFLQSMKQEYGVEPKVEHYGCVVDLLGRVGLLNEAEEVINSMPIEPNAAVWGALLGACRKHRNVELGERVGKIVLELEPRNSGRYALLSNIYAKAGRWEDVANLRQLMKERGVKTITGRSVIDLDGTVHEFKMGDESHPQVKEIYSLLERVIGKLLLEGYLPNTSQVLFDIEEEEKENSLRYHSEKLAIAFGLLKTTPGATIRIVKNLRVCDDCHSATKLISKIYKRKIIVRDRVRYHHFENGTCSCRDFW